MFWGIVTMVLLTNCDELASLSLTRSRSRPHRDGGAGDRALAWENGLGVPQGGQVPNLIREGSAEIGGEMMGGSGDGGAHEDDEDLLLGEADRPDGDGGTPHPSIGPSFEVGRPEKAPDSDAKDWSKEYEYDSDNYDELDDVGDEEKMLLKLPTFLTEGQKVTVDEGSELVLPCQVMLPVTTLQK